MIIKLGDRLKAELRTKDQASPINDHTRAAPPLGDPSIETLFWL